MKHYTVTCWFLLIAISGSAPLYAQGSNVSPVKGESGILVAIDLPKIEALGNGADRLDTQNFLPLPVPSCLARDVVFMARSIELSPEQTKQIDAKIQHAALDYLRDMQQLNDSSASEPEKIQELKQVQDRFRQKVESIVHEALLPHQREKLKQAQIRATVQRLGGRYATASELSSELNLTDEQCERLRVLIEHESNRLYVELEEWRAARQLELLKETLGDEKFQKLAAFLEDQ